MTKEPACCVFCQRCRADHLKLLLFPFDGQSICTDCGGRIGRLAAEAQASAISRRDLAWKDGPAISIGALLAGIVSALDAHPDEWWAGDGLVHHPSGLTILARWDAGSIRLLIPGRDRLRPTFWQRRRLWRAVTTWRTRPFPSFGLQQEQVA